MKTLLLILVFGMVVPVGAQETNTSRILAETACKESTRAIGYEDFSESIKKGERGEGVHYTWMDDMQQLGIKQAFFVVHFSYRNGAYKYRIKEAHYLRHYYCYEGEVTGGKLRRQIRKSGLERELNDAIIARIKRFEKPYQVGNVTEGDVYHYLLDDENLPIIDFVT
jgi:hypothetical protein